MLADPPKVVMSITRPGQVTFKPSPIVPGAANSVISGDPRAPAQPYVVRNRFAPGTFSPAAFSPGDAWWVGSGPIFDKDKTFPMPAIMGVGPSATIRVDESGKPKN